jgi:NodT family efflux transporter outer membrane factor (OMF) lipoprotein
VAAAGSVGVILAGLLAGGCAMGPRYRQPVMGMPEAFSEPMPGTSATRPSSTTAPATRNRPVDLARWWESLDDPLLTALVRDAVQSNLDLKIAVARFQEARALQFATTGGYAPGVGGFGAVGFNAAAARGSGSDSTRSRTSGPINAAINTKGLTEVTHAIGFDAAWELDLFGRITHLDQAALADTQAALEFRNEVLVSVVSDVVRAYISVRTLQWRLDVARNFVQTQQQTVNLARSRLNRGLGNDLDVALAERQLSAALARIAPLEEEVAAAKRLTAVLLGKFPDEFRRELDHPMPLPATPPRIAAGMPAELLRRRPDIRRSERELAAATARIGVATAELFPRVAITGGVGIQGQGLGQVPVTSSGIYSIGPTLYWPLLDFGQLDAAVHVQDFRTQQQLFRYQRTIINAVREVDDSIGRYASNQDRLARLGDAVGASERAVRLATQRYNNGLTDFLNVLDAERQLYDLQDQYAIAHESVLTQFISLYKSLGGGWEGYEAPPAPTYRPAIMAAVSEAAHAGEPAPVASPITPDPQTK